MKNEINNNKTLFVLTILFCLILNGARAETNDEIKTLVRDQYSEKSISYIFSDVINKLPTLNNQIYGVECLFELMRENNDVKDTEKIFEYARQYNKFLEQNWTKIKEFNLKVNVKLPECVETVVIKSKYICFDTGNYTLQTSSSTSNTNVLYYLHENSNCKTVVHKRKFYWKVISEKPDNIQDLQSMNLVRQLRNVKFELAPDGERCYVQVDGKYLTKNGESRYITLRNDKTSNGIWYVRSQYLTGVDSI